MDLPKKPVDTSRMNLQEAIVHFQTKRGVPLNNVVHQWQLNDVLRGHLGILYGDKRLEAEIKQYLAIHDRGRVHLSAEEQAWSVRASHGKLRLSPYQRLRFWVLDKLGRHKR